MARSSLTAQLAAQILDHIRANELPRGQHLPSQALADACRVSRAPINSAFKILQNLGVVRFQSNRGYFLAADANELAALKLLANEGGDEDDAYFEIAEDRLSGKLPAQVTESELMRLYRLPRSRLVRILSKIAQEGWIERLPGHGWEFRPTLTDRKSYEAGYRFRASIESAAVLEPGFRIDRDAFRAAREQQQALLEADLKKLSRARLFRINTELHETIVACSGNEFFLDALKRVNRLRRLIEYRVTVDRSRLNRQCREHLKILDLLEAGNVTAASAFLREHIEGANTLKSPGVEQRPGDRRKKDPA
ncbi:MAG TPA: GntR family transcriptional regulator [Steroidobacteraceae bacterium]|jgi:DNA-binding GntR family transcriptional regulator|nr:GntR family transcriptional regulator [Steroidobacteraceae bacterium]